MASSQNIIIMIIIVTATFMIAVMNWRDSRISDGHPLEKEMIKLQHNIDEKRSQLKHIVETTGKSVSSGQTVSQGDIHKEHQQTPEDPHDHENAPVIKQASHPFVSTLPYKIPGGSDHRILSLSDSDFENVKLSEMMSWYGEADGGHNCPGDFGNELVNRWRATRKTYCASTGFIDGAEVGSSQAIDSSIDCFPVKQTRHHGVCDNLCIMKDVSINAGIFGNNDVTAPVIKRYVSSRHMDLPYVHYDQGFLRSTCNPLKMDWDEKFLPGWNADLTVKAMQTVSKSDVGKSYACKEWFDHPVLIIQRDTFANFFHDSEDFVNVFLSMAILQWSRGETQILLTDLFPQGPFWDMWTKVFSPAHSITADPADAKRRRVLTAWDLREKYGDDWHSRICFRQAAVGIYGPAAPITVASWNTPCSRTALIRAYSDFVIRGLNLQESSHYARPVPEKTINILYMARRAYSEWPEKRFCNDTHSFFQCQYWNHMGAREIGRVIRNDAAFSAALKALEQEDFGDRQVKIMDSDFNKLSFEEQIRRDLQTDIMIGPHGAGLMHNIFMRDRGVLMELSLDGSGVNRHFHNLAHWFGRTYHGLGVSNPVNIADVVETVRQNVTKTYWRELIQIFAIGGDSLCK